jgi:hypothetical protein
MLQVRLYFATHEFVEMLHSVLERRLVGPRFDETLLHEGAASLRHAIDDLGVFDCGLAVGCLLGLYELALEERDLFRVVELDHVGAGLRTAWNERADHERVWIPLHHDVREIGEPDCAVNRLATLVEAQHLLVPAAVGGAAGFGKGALDPARLHAVPVAEFPLEIAHVDEIAETGMEGLYVVVLEIHFNEGLPVAGVLLDVDAVENVAGEIELG